MGCPENYYKKALQNLVRMFGSTESDYSLKNKPLNELENIIREKKKSMKKKTFYYGAGFTAGLIFERYYENDQYACTDGIDRYEEFIKNI